MDEKLYKAETEFLKNWNMFKKSGSIKYAMSFVKALDNYDALLKDIELDDREM